MAAQISFGPRFHPRSAPVTFWLIVTAAGLLLVAFLTSLTSFGRALAVALPLVPGGVGARPWTLLTWPLLNYTDPFWFLLTGYVMWWVGSDLERWWGSRVQAGFLLAVTLAVGGLVLVGRAVAPGLVAQPLFGFGPWLAALFTIWGLQNRERQVLLFFILPISGLVIALVSVASIWFAYGVYQGFFVVLGSAGLGALYYWQGQQFHRWLRRFGPPQGQAKRGEVKAQRDRDRKFQRIMKGSGLHLVDDEESSGDSR